MKSHDDQHRQGTKPIETGQVHDSAEDVFANVVSVIEPVRHRRDVYRTGAHSGPKAKNPDRTRRSGFFID
jgi:hypothetical protein